MKRTLLEILGGLAALALLIFFSHQVATLKIQNRDLYQIREQVQRAVATAGTQEEVLEMRREVLDRMDNRLAELEEQLAVANRDTQKALKLRAEIEAARMDVDRITADFLSTVDLVNGYVDESRSEDKKAEASIFHLTQQLMLDPGGMTRSMLAPTVQLNGEDTVGSGTLVFSGENEKTGKIESYVLTSYHVVRNILADMPRAKKEKGIDITVYLEDKRVAVKGKMVAHNRRIDAALVKLNSSETFPHVARALPKALRENVRIWEPVIAVGCPLGNDPVPTQGTIGSLDNELNGSNYWMINAPTYFGNSGGGVYLANSRQLIGVFSKIYTHGKGNPVVIPHMGLCTPISLVHEWLEKEKLDYLLQADVADVNLASPAPGPGK